jgi:protoporphyrinogen oxidase
MRIGTKMHIAVVGGGLMGMTLAYFLSENGQQVTVLEQSASIGGLHDTIEIEKGLSIGRYQYNVFPGDRHTLELINQLKLKDEVLLTPAHSGFVHNGDTYPMRTIWDFLTFSPLRLRDRLRLGQTIVQAKLAADWRSLDKIPVKDWLIQTGGKSNFERIWAPLLEAKFDYDYNQVPATFIWSWLNRATGLRNGPEFRASVAQLRHGPGILINAMADAIRAQGGDIQTQARVREIEIENGQLGRVRTPTGLLDFDAVVAAVPTTTFGLLLPSADEKYLSTLADSRYLGLVCAALVLDRPLSDYWTLNLTDPSSPFSSIVEIPHPDDPRYHIVYLPKYTAPENDWMGVPDEAIQDAWLLRLRQIYPSLKNEHIKHFVVSRSRYVDPLHFLNAAERIPAVDTPYDGLYLANTSQVYPDLPTSEAVIAHARRLAQQIITQSARQRVAQTAA